MTGLRKFGTKDLGAIVDAVERYGVGVDDLFYRLHSYGMGTPQNSYPPYNMVKESETKWRIELALAGFSKTLKLPETNVEIISSRQRRTRGMEVHAWGCNSNLPRGFNPVDVEVGGAFENGLLIVELNRIVPEHQKRRFTISNK